MLLLAEYSDHFTTWVVLTISIALSTSRKYKQIKEVYKLNFADFASLRRVQTSAWSYQKGWAKEKGPGGNF
jgi:hypothetical protein